MTNLVNKSLFGIKQSQVPKLKCFELLHIFFIWIYLLIAHRQKIIPIWIRKFLSLHLFFDKIVDIFSVDRGFILGHQNNFFYSAFEKLVDIFHNKCWKGNISHECAFFWNEAAAEWKYYRSFGKSLSHELCTLFFLRSHFCKIKSFLLKIFPTYFSARVRKSDFGIFT